MKDDWGSYEKAAEKGPIALFLKILVPLLIIGAIIGTIGFVGGWFGEGVQVLKEEVGPRAMLKKYEWFKDVSAQLDRKNADIEVYKNRLKNMEESYEGEKRKDWDRTDKEQYNLWNQEIAGVIASFNDLAAEYNAQHAKINWRFADIGMLPQGATEPLTREYRTYKSN